MWGKNAYFTTANYAPWSNYLVHGVTNQENTLNI